MGAVGSVCPVSKPRARTPGACAVATAALPPRSAGPWRTPLSTPHQGGCQLVDRVLHPLSWRSLLASWAAPLPARCTARTEHGNAHTAQATQDPLCRCERLVREGLRVRTPPLAHSGWWGTVLGTVPLSLTWMPWAPTLAVVRTTFRSWVRLLLFVLVHACLQLCGCGCACVNMHFVLCPF